MNCSYKSYSKVARFKDLVMSVQHCDLCQRLCFRNKVLSEANGNINSKVLFVAEAPGRLGADRTGIPLYGDKTGDNFESLLGNIGWKRNEIFITNAVLCNPRKEDGTNGTPTRDEIDNCMAFLEMTIRLVMPEVIVSLGITALDSLNRISPHGIQLRDGVATLIPWFGAKLFPLYHPGPRAIVHRSIPKQRSDFIQLSKIVHPIEGLIDRKKHKAKSTSGDFTVASSLQQVVRVLLELSGKMTYFKLTKLLYLIDLFSIEKLGYMVASNIYLRQTEGPWVPNLKDDLDKMMGYEARSYLLHGVPIVTKGPSPRFEIQLDDNVLEIINDVFRIYGAMSNSQIKTAVYRTEPMQFLLQEEKKGGKAINRPVLYKNKTAQQLAEDES